MKLGITGVPGGVGGKEPAKEGKLNFFEKILDNLIKLGAFQAMNLTL